MKKTYTAPFLRGINLKNPNVLVSSFEVNSEQGSSVQLSKEVNIFDSELKTNDETEE